MNLELDPSDTLTDELDALTTIGRTLANLPDPAARLRVLRWAIARFQPETTSAQTATVLDRRDDPGLAVESLAELFGPTTTAARDEPPDAPAPAPASQVRRLVKDVRRMVHWQRA